MPSKLSCFKCGRRIQEDLEIRINGHVYGSDCAKKIIDGMDSAPVQEEAFRACGLCGSFFGHAYWCIFNK